MHSTHANSIKKTLMIFMPWRFCEYQFPRAKPQREMKKSFEIFFYGLPICQRTIHMPLYPCQFNY
ncbi:MAG TPA: hypothetical protein PLN79_13340, partial [bacterium]|nr:hypothetical protein [bacterium]